MKNKLDKEYLLELYRTYEEDNMVYALTMLKSLGLTEWFRTIELNFYGEIEIDMLVKNIKFIEMFKFDMFDCYQIYRLIEIDNVIDYFNQDQLDKLYVWQIKYIIFDNPELEKYFINCVSYEKQTK